MLLILFFGCLGLYFLLNWINSNGSKKNFHLVVSKKEIVILSGTNPDLAKKTASLLGIEMIKVKATKFENGESFVNIGADVSGKHVYIVTSIQGTVNDCLMELLLMTDACKQDKAKTVTAVLPLLPYSRQDRITTPGTPLSASLIAKLMSGAGIDNVISMDLHSESIKNIFSDMGFSDLKAEPIFRDWIKLQRWKTCVIVSPDAGGASRAQSLSEQLEVDFCVIRKERIKANEVKSMTLYDPEKVQGRVAVIIDDMFDTCSTLILASKILKEAGASQVVGLATHGIFSGQAIDRIKNSEDLDLVVVTNSIPKVEEKGQKIRYIDASTLIAKAIIESETITNV